MSKSYVAKDDVEGIASTNGLRYQAVDPVTREPTGPLRKNHREALADDNAAFERKAHKLLRGERDE